MKKFRTLDYAIVIRSKTRLEMMTERFNTINQVEFYLKSNNSDYGFYEREHDNFYRSFDRLCQILSNTIKYKVIDRSFISSFIFSDNQLIIVIGQDGLVANTAKYAKGQPIIGVNPDPEQYDGVLLPYNKDNIQAGLDNIMGSSSSTINVTMAEAKFSDGQTLLAFNDFYIGSATHTSSRYTINFNNRTENHSSSGLIISTGAGSTGWMSSVFNMQRGIGQLCGTNIRAESRTLQWDDKELMFVVREPFLSKASGIETISGNITKSNELRLESLMPNNGVVFSDGIEKDYIQFNSGTMVRIGVSDKEVNIVMEKEMIAKRKAKKKKISKGGGKTSQKKSSLKRK